MALAVVSIGSSANNISGVARFRESKISHFTGTYAGSTETWKTRVTLRNSFKVVGISAYACVKIDNNTSIKECQATYLLPMGRVQIEGLIISSKAYQMIIVGGTGTYSNAMGNATFSDGLVTFYFT